MSYNIDHVETTDLDASMEAADVCFFLDEHEFDLPEGCFLHEIAREARRALREGEPKRPIKLPNFWWYGTGSGNSFDFLKNEVASKIKGVVRALLTWEGGDSHSALVIRDGRAMEPKLKIVMEE